jgi:hypothetical protein
MPHMVIYRSSDGKPGYHQAEALEEAVRFVEHLRNSEQAAEARIFRMHEVAIEFKTYYRVEVAAAEEAPVRARVSESTRSSAPVAGGSAGPVAETPETPPPSSNGTGRFGLFGKG